MQQKANLTHFILASVVALGLMLLMVAVEAQAQIAFSSNRTGNFEIYVMDADGGNQRKLTKNLQPDNSPSWSPDGKRIAFGSKRDGNWEIYVMDANGRNQRRRTKHGSYDGSPAWYTPALAVAPAGKKTTMWGWLKQIDR